MKPVQSVSFSTLVAVLALTRQTYCFPNFDDWNVLLSQNIENCKSEAITPDGRSVDQLQQLNWALEDAITIAHHGIIAATKPEEPPFNYFFRPTDNETVVQHLQMVIDLREYPTSFRPGTHVSMECNDPDWCTLPNQWGITNLWYGEQLNWGYVFYPLLAFSSLPHATLHKLHPKVPAQSMT